MIYGSTTPLQSVAELSDMGYHLVFRPLSGKQPHQTLHASHSPDWWAASSLMHAEHSCSALCSTFTPPL